MQRSHPYSAFGRDLDVDYTPSLQYRPIAPFFHDKFQSESNLTRETATKTLLYRHTKTWLCCVEVAAGAWRETTRAPTYLPCWRETWYYNCTANSALVYRERAFAAESDFIPLFSGRSEKSNYRILRVRIAELVFVSRFDYSFRDN